MASLRSGRNFKILPRPRIFLELLKVYLVAYPIDCQFLRMWCIYALYAISTDRHLCTECNIDRQALGQATK